MEKRNYNIEVLRVISFMFVIVVHSANYYCEEFGRIIGKQFAFAYFINVCARVCVPCFFMISGALLLGREESVSKCIKRVGKYIRVLVVWSVIYYLYNVYIMGKDVNLYEVFNKPTEKHLWYLYALIPIMAFLPFFQMICKNMKEEHEKWFVAIGVYSIIITCFGAEFYYNNVFFGSRPHFILLFFVGYFISKRIDKISVHNSVLVVIFVVSAFINTLFGVYMSYEKGEYCKYGTYYINPFILCNSIILFILVLRIKDGQLELKGTLKKIVDLVCRYSFGIYLSHILYLDALKLILDKIYIPAYIGIPSMICIVGVVTLGTVWILSKNKITKMIM
ncbi:MAG: acyltransferase [Lachnospiraceae bacterium]|nr:acyltransferase [Lachnospiraceae bacterium]